jgi:2-dehydrotetronate isomerase
MPKFAANLSMMFHELEFYDRFRAAANAGFPAVEYLFPYEYSAEKIARLLEEEGLSQALFNMPPGNWAAGDRGLAAIPERREEFKAGVKSALEYARIIRTPLLHMMAGIADSGSAVAREAYKYSLAFAADLAAEQDIRIVIEPINSRDMPGYFLDSFERATEIMDAVGSSNVGLQFDIYHRQVMRGDVLTALKSLMPRIGHIQVAAVPLRSEPGTGELDDHRIFSEIDRLGFQGFVGCEYRPTAGTVAGLEWLARTKSK